MLSYNIALGANINSSVGSPIETLKACIEKFEKKNISIKKMSNWYESEAFPNPLDPPFVNCCLSVETVFKPQELLNFFLRIEEVLGRKEKKRWGPRVCDIDILSQGQQILPNRSEFNYWYKMDFEIQKIKKPTELIIPHPRIQDRDFVLVPFCEIEENWFHPFLKKNIKKILNEFLNKRPTNLKKIY